MVTIWRIDTLPILVILWIDNDPTLSIPHSYTSSNANPKSKVYFRGTATEANTTLLSAWWGEGRRKE